jgi:hypothetical protein
MEHDQKKKKKNLFSIPLKYGRRPQKNDMENDLKKKMEDFFLGLAQLSKILWYIIVKFCELSQIL